MWNRSNEIWIFSLATVRLQSDSHEVLGSLYIIGLAFELCLFRYQLKANVVILTVSSDELVLPPLNCCNMDFSW